jgi:hypothetical protein
MSESYTPPYERAISKLIHDFGLDDSMYFRTGSGFETKIVLRRTAIDLIESRMNIQFRTKAMSASSLDWGVLMEARIPPGSWVETAASAGPDTTTFAYRLEIAYKRARHRLVIKLAQLSHLGVYSEDESDEFAQVDQSAKRVESVMKDIPAAMKASPPETLHDTIEKIYGNVEKLKSEVLKSKKRNENPNTENTPEAGDVHAGKNVKGGKAEPGKPGGFAPRRVNK